MATIQEPDRDRPPRLPARLGRLTEHHVLLPVVILLVLAVVWGAAWNFIRIDRNNAEQVAAALSRELTETYEAQVVRALREIDQTLKFVKYAYERQEGRVALDALKARELLLSDLLFEISIADRAGRIVASSRTPAIGNLAGAEDFERLRHSDGIEVSAAWKNAKTQEWLLRFGRRLNDARGEFAGAVTLTVGAAYFVSGYEPAKLGEHGVLALLGVDGVFRALRSGEAMAAGDRVDVAAMLSDEGDETRSRLVLNPWDGVRRYTVVRQIYDFPLVVLVGLSEDEQLATSRDDGRSYLWRAAAASAVLLFGIALLWQVSSQLAAARRREAEARVEYAERVEYLAYHDGLTGLPNRSLFSKLLEQGIVQARRHERKLAVLFLDLDRFKQINDTLGHDAGDELLKEVARRLKGCLRESDTVARLGGDEFVVLLPELGDEKYIPTVARKMLATVARPFMLIGQEFRVTVSIGISVYPGDGEDEETLKKNADIAMYQAKEEGKNNFQFYSAELNANSLERLSLESGLRRALEHGEFELHYQARRDMDGKRITGMEALLRWHHPDLGVVAPMKFIPVADETGLILPIGKWVLKTACAQNVAWRKQGLPRLSIAVNLSAHQFHDENLLPDVEAVLRETGMEAELLELEISESMLMRDVPRTLGILRALKALGVRIAIDDFGVGYSSLAAFQQFPIDTIKIDRSLIRGVTTVEEDRHLTTAIIAMGRSLSMMVVAQGVESEEQVELLRAQSCEEFQGFYFNPPMPAGQLVELLRNQLPPPPSAA